MKHTATSLLALLVSLALIPGAAAAESLPEEMLEWTVEEESVQAEEEFFSIEEEAVSVEPVEALEAIESVEEELPILIEEETEETIVLSGKWGTCNWTISDKGVLTIGKGKGADTCGFCPWEDYADSIKSVKTSPNVVLPQDCSYLLSIASYQSEADAYASNCTSMSLTGFITSGATNMTSMFFGCSTLATLNISGFRTGGVTDIEQM